MVVVEKRWNLSIPSSAQEVAREPKSGRDFKIVFKEGERGRERGGGERERRDGRGRRESEVTLLDPSAGEKKNLFSILTYLCLYLIS